MMRPKPFPTSIVNTGSTYGNPYVPGSENQWQYKMGGIRKKQIGGIIPKYNFPTNMSPSHTDSLSYNNYFENAPILASTPSDAGTPANYGWDEYKNHANDSELDYQVDRILPVAAFESYRGGRPDIGQQIQLQANAYKDWMGQKAATKGNPWYAGLGEMPKKKQVGGYAPFVEDNLDDYDNYLSEDDNGYWMKSGGWIAGAINPKHKGFCSPVTKKTCTPRRKAFAMRAKNHFK